MKLSSIKKETEEEKQALKSEMLRYEREMEQMEKVKETLEKELVN